MIAAYLSLGSNLDDPMAHVKQGVREISLLPETQLLSVSSLYQSAPMGPQDQPYYINAVVLIHTQLNAEILLNELHQIEDNHDRQRGSIRWEARTLDLDILLYGDEIISSDRLIVPHEGLKARYFVLLPLYEITPNLLLPCGTTVESALGGCQQQYDLVRLGESCV